MLGCELAIIPKTILFVFDKEKQKFLVVFGIEIVNVWPKTYHESKTILCLVNIPYPIFLIPHYKLVLLGKIKQVRSLEM